MRPLMSRHPPCGRSVPVRFSPSRHRVIRFSQFKRASSSPRVAVGTMASADFPGHFLPGISPDKNALLPGTTAAFTSATEPCGLCCVVPARPPRRPCYAVCRSLRSLPRLRAASAFGGLSVGPPVSASLPPPGRLPFQSWLRVMI